MASAASRASLVSRLRRNRTSSPQMEEFETATSQTFDAARDAIHSTAQIADYSLQHSLPQQQQAYQDDLSETRSSGSADMSMEIGRGMKRGTQHQDEDMSSNAVFQLDGGDSLYELTATPPIRSRKASARKTDDGLRRQASIRRAAETAKSVGNAKRSTSLKQSTLTDALNKINAEDDTSFVDEQPATATFNARSTRFSRSRQGSGYEQARAGSAQQTPRWKANNATVQSNSFALPDLPNLTELVSGVRKDGTPVFNRTAKSRSRFASSTHRPSRPEYRPVENVPIPDEEKAIYSSLQVLQARLSQLEDEKDDAERRAEDYENQIIDLRTQLAMSQGRPDSGLGSDEERPDQQTTRLRASKKSLQERLDRSERKFTNSEITCKRITNERDQLLQQIGVAYYNIEDLKQEVEDSHGRVGSLEAENEGLKEEVDELRKEIEGLRLLAQQTQASYDDDSVQRDRREADLRRKLEKRSRMAREMQETTRELWEVQSGTAKRRASQNVHAAEEEQTREQQRYGDLESRVAEAVAKARQDARSAEKTASSQRSRGINRDLDATRARSKSANRSKSHGREQQTTQSKRASLPSPVKSKPSMPREEDTRDLTLLTWTDPAVFVDLRKQLEDERREARQQRATSAPAEQNTTTQSGEMTRKSSLKDIATGFDEDTGRFSIASGNGLDFNRVTKSVRVQSPHTSDESIAQHNVQPSEAGDTSVLSNTSRRRRRAVSAEGLTSAFILPDITLRGSSLPNPAGPKTIPHDPNSCTACPAGQDATIPLPVPVSSREVNQDLTHATIRPAEDPKDALARVIKEHEDEIRHLKLRLAGYQRQYAQHDPALSWRKRKELKGAMEEMGRRVEKLCDQVYRLYDVLEGQKEAEATNEADGEGKEDDETVERE